MQKTQVFCSSLNNCCVFQPAFMCLQHLKAGRNIFSDVDQPLLFISKLFQWFHGWNQQKSLTKKVEKQLKKCFIQRVLQASKSWLKYTTNNNTGPMERHFKAKGITWRLPQTLACQWKGAVASLSENSRHLWCWQVCCIFSTNRWWKSSFSAFFCAKSWKNAKNVTNLV